MTALEKHCAFFDRNKDGIILPHETFEGFRALGYNVFVSLVGTVLVHLFFSYPTLDTWIPDPFFSIYVRNVHRCKHGSDTGTYDHEGNSHVPPLDTMLAKFDVGGKNGLTLVEGLRMTAHCRDVFDPFGWMAAILEWGFLYLLCAERGVVSKEAILSQYDGTLFYKIEQARKQKGQ